MKIGVVGNGFVGGAVRNGFSPNVGCDAEVKVYDKNPTKSTHSLLEVVNDSDFVFILFSVIKLLQKFVFYVRPHNIVQ